MKKSSRDLYFNAPLCVVVAAAVAASGYLAWVDPFWLDELSSYWLSSGPDIASVFERAVARRDPHPPGYQLALFLWLQVPGTEVSGGASRASSLLALAITLFAGAALSTRLARSKAAGLAFAVIFGSLAYVPFYGSELRSYMGQQAALVVLLLVRHVRRESEAQGGGIRRYLYGLEYLASLVLGTFHFVGSLFVGTFVLFDLVGELLKRQGRPLAERVKRVSLTLPYLVGPLLSLGWLLWTTPARQLKVASVERFLVFFVEACGPLQLLACLVTLTVFWFSSPRGGKGAFHQPVFFDSGAVVVFVAIVLLALVSQVQPALQKRNILLFWPPQVVLLGVAVSRLASQRSRFLVLCLFPLSAAPGFGERLQDDQRAGDNFGFFFELNFLYPLFLESDDIAQKVMDAGGLELSDRTSHHPIIARKTALLTGAAREESTLKQLGEVAVGCPHCKKRTWKELRKAARRYGFVSCKELATPSTKGKVQICRKNKKARRRSRRLRGRR